MTLTLTLILMAMTLGLMVFTGWQSGRPPKPPKVRMVPWMLITILLGGLFMLLFAHVYTLFGFETGQMFNRF